MKNNKRRLGLCLAALVPLAAIADEPPAEAEFFGEFPVVLSASRLAQPANEAPASVTVIDRDMIRASGVRELADLFRLVPGMTVGRRNGYSPMLGFNGFGDTYFRQFQVLVDGVSIYSPLYGGVEWGELPFALEDVERIEVVRGPNAATFGANSFLGVVNIITRDPATDPTFEAAVNGGDNHVSDALVRYARNSGDWRYRISTGERADHGLASLPDTRRSNFLNLRSHYRLNANDELRVQFGYAGGFGEEGRFGSGTNGPRPAKFETMNFQVRWTQANGPDDEFWAQFSHAERIHHEALPYTLTVGPFNFDYPLDFGYDHQRTDLEMQRTLRLGDTLRSVWGAQAREDAARSQTYFNRPDWLTSRLLRLFGNLEWRFARDWLLHAGAMYESNSITSSSLSPSLALVTHLTPEHTLRARIASAHRTPTLFEDQSNWRYAVPAGLAPFVPLLCPTCGPSTPLAQSSLTPNPLSDEKILSREISYLAEFPALRMNLDVTVFDDRLRNMISQYSYPYLTVLGTTTYGFRNQDWANSRGTNLDMRWQPWQGSRLNLAASRSIIESNNGDIAWSRTAPRHTVSVLWQQELPANMSFSAGYYRVGTMRWIGTTDTLPAFDRVDIRVAKRFQWGSHKAELAWVTQNTFDPVSVFQLKTIEERTSWLRLQYEY